MYTNIKKLSQVDVVLYNMGTKTKSASMSKKSDKVNETPPRYWFSEDQQTEKEKERMRDMRVTIYKEFFSHTSKSRACCVDYPWFASEEVILMDINTAASLGDCGAIDAALARFEKINHCCKYFGWTPIMNAANRNRFVAVKHLISKGANVCTHAENDGITAFCLAAAGGTCDTVEAVLFEMLLQKHVAFLFGTSLVFEASNKEMQEKLPWLQQDFDEVYQDLVSLSTVQNQGLDSWDHYGWTALMHAISSAPVAVINMLLEKGCNVNVVDVIERTPLMLAIECNREDIVLILLKYGADPTYKTKTGLTTMEFAETSESLQIINMVQAAADFKLAMKNKDLCVVILLLAGLGLRKHIPKFIEHNIDVKKFNGLTEDDLRSLGLTNMGPRKRVMKAVKERRLPSDSDRIRENEAGK